MKQDIERKTFALDQDEIVVAIHNLKHRFFFTIQVNGNLSREFGTNVVGQHMGWCVVSSYYDCWFRPWEPFKLVYANVHFKDLPEQQARKA